MGDLEDKLMSVERLHHIIHITNEAFELRFASDRYKQSPYYHLDFNNNVLTIYNSMNHSYILDVLAVAKGVYQPDEVPEQYDPTGTWVEPERGYD